MKRTHAVLAALTLGTVSLAHADVPANPLQTPWSRPQGTYVLMEPGLPTLDGDGVSALAASNVIYLNNCKPNGCQVTPGNEDSRQNRSIIPRQPSTVRPFAYDDAVWKQVVDCVRATYAPFNVRIVTERPASGDYHMAIVAGLPQDVQMQAGVGGVSPFTCGYINNAISYSFANVYGPNVDEICWTVAQETAHSWGLDHKFDERDPMTYLPSGPSRKVFQNEDGPCGEFNQRACMCGGSTMNSYQEILATFGPGTCQTADDCDEGMACVDERCVPGPGTTGGLGETCVRDEDCAGGQCNVDTEGNGYCTAECDPAKKGCPTGFGCVKAGDSGVCWPGADEDGGGCNAGGNASGLGLLGVALAALVTRRRRR
jgi:uncharacterized protein (TIGR03382 family)